MSGVRFSIIGGEVKQGIRKFISGVPERVYPEKEGLLQFNAVLLDLDQNKISRST
jgi:calcineurin-like phosphoesterase